jgi:hypothetical protein
MGGPKHYESMYLFVLLLYGGKDQRSQGAAEGPAGMRDNARHYIFRQRAVRGSGIETFVYSVYAGVVLARIKLARHYRFSCLHFQYPLTDVQLVRSDLRRITEFYLAILCAVI